MMLYYVVLISDQQANMNASGLIISSQISHQFIKLPENGTAKLKFSIVRLCLCTIPLL